MTHRLFRPLLIILAVFGGALGVLAVQVEVLPNGLTLAVEENHTAPVVAVRFYVKIGSVYEGNYLGAGISHFIEHCVGQGTPTRSRQEIDDLIESMGNQANAYTASAHTCYYITTSAKYLNGAAELIADYVFHADFPLDAVKTQRGIILREIAMGDDDPDRRIWNLFTATAFQSHPARYRIIGYEHQFNLLQRADLVAFHAATYTPDNVVVVVVGDFDGREVMTDLGELLAKEPKAAVRRSVLPNEAEQTAPRRRVESDPGLHRTYLFVGWPTVDLFNPDLYALDVAAYILGYGESSRLNARLRDELGIVDAISAFSYTPTYDAGIFGIRAVLDPANLKATEETIAAEVARLTSEPVAPAELQKALTQKAAEIIYAQETIEGRASVLGNDLVSSGNPEFSAIYVDNIRKVTPADVMRVAVKYFRPEKLNTAVLGPPALATDVHVEPPPDPSSARIISHRLDNGMLLLVQEAHHSPTVSMLAAFKGGVRYETEDTNGLSNLTAAMLTRGTKNRTYEQIATSIDMMAAVLTPFSGRNTFGLEAQCTSDTFPSMLEIFADCLSNPTFPADQLKRQRHLTLAAIEARADDVDSVAFDLLAANLYKAHPYRMPLIGTRTTVASLTQSQLVDFYSRYARPNGMVLAVLGDVQADDVIKQVATRFSGLEIGEIMPPAIASEPAQIQPTTKTVKREQQQAIVTYGFPGPTITAENRYTLDVMAAVLAGMGMPGGRLHEALRGAELVYATWGFSMPGIETGHFVIYAGTRPDKVAQVKTTIEEVISGMTTDEPDAAELARAKSMAIAAQQIALQANLDRAQTIVLDQLYGLGFDNYTRYADNIAAVRAEDVRKCAGDLLDLSRATITMTQPE
jgi:zinc protease